MIMDPRMGPKHLIMVNVEQFDFVDKSFNFGIVKLRSYLVQLTSPFKMALFVVILILL